MVFLDTLRGWACGSEVWTSGLATYEVGKIWKTEDEGKTWTGMYAGGNFVSSIYFSTEDIAWLGSRYDDHWGLIEKSNDGGETWDVQEIPQVLSIEKIFFLNDKRGWAVGNKYTTKNGESYWVTQLLHTVDGGEIWELQNDDFEAPINDIHFINDSSGIAIHRYYRDSRSSTPSFISVTSDGGYNWEIHSRYYHRLGGIHFVDEETGWIVGENSLILKTNDGGMNWAKQENFVVIDNPDTVDTNDTTDTTDNNNLPEHIELLQNYPNPFNSSTHIDYSISEPSMVSLKIYDLLGTEIEMLVNQYQEADRYSIVFNGDKISSGLYFYTLTIDDKYFYTKKMLLIR